MTEREILKQSIDAHQVAINKAKSRLSNLPSKFSITVSGSGVLKMEVIYNAYIENRIIFDTCVKAHCTTATASISEAYKIRGALSRLIALAERNQ